MSKDWYSVNEVAEILGESYKTIYNLVVTGVLGHYRIGRSYRIRKTDLEAYFARQDKELVPVLVAAPALPEAVVLDKAGAVALHAYESGAEPERRPDRLVHAPGRESPVPEAHTSPVGELASQDAVTAAVQQGKVYSSRAARRREADYVEEFRALFHSGLVVSHPTVDERIKLEDWERVEQVEDELLQLGQYLGTGILRPEEQVSYPNNVRVLYWIEPNSLAGIMRRYPKEGLVIECATLSRLERFVNAGRDEEKMHWAAAEKGLQERKSLMQLWSTRYGAPIAYLVGLASTTGWDEESIDRVRAYADNVRLLPYLVDLVTLEVYAPHTHKQGAEYLELFERSLGDSKAKRIEQQVAELLFASRAMRFADLQAQVGCSPGLLREVCDRLVKNSPDYMSFYEGDSMVIRFG